MSSGRSLPSTRICGAELVVTWRSVPPISVMVFRSWCRLTATITSWSQHGLAQDFLDGRHADLDLLQAAHAEGEHPLLQGLPLDLDGGGPDHDQVADAFRDLHHFVKAHAAL